MERLRGGHRHVEAARRSLTGTTEPGDADLEAQQALVPLLWGDRVASRGPDELDDDARAIADAMRLALRRE